MENCLFCKIIARSIPAAIEYEDEDVLIFRDISPQAPTHCLVIPKKHIAGASALGISGDDAAAAGNVLVKASAFARERGITDYRLVINNGAQAGQTVFHLHVHLLGGRAMKWPPG